MEDKKAYPTAQRCPRQPDLEKLSKKDFVAAPNPHNSVS